MKQPLSNLPKLSFPTQHKVSKQLNLLGKPISLWPRTTREGSYTMGPTQKEVFTESLQKRVCLFFQAFHHGTSKSWDALPLLPLRCQNALGSRIGHSHSPPTWFLRACLVLGMGEGNTGPWSCALMSLALEQRKENERVQETAHNTMFSEHLPGPQDHLVMAMSAEHGKCYLRSPSDTSATEREPTHKHNP